MVKFGRWSKLQVLSVGFAVTVALLSSACETTGSAERAWLHGMNWVPVASLQEGQSSLLAEILKNPGGWQGQDQAQAGNQDSGRYLPSRLRREHGRPRLVDKV